MACNGSASPAGYHFTGKERDAESGNDYFGARYYGSSMGRWMSPDWSADPDPIPYADPENPQTLNLYGYLSNNPVSGSDPDGHLGCVNGQAAGCNQEAAELEEFKENTAAFEQEQTQSLDLQRVPAATSSITVRANIGCDPSTSFLCELNYRYLITPNQQIKSFQIAAAGATYAFFSTAFFSKNIEHNNPNPTKGARPVKDKNGKITGWTIPGKGADSGKRIPKSFDWGKANGLNPNDAKWALGAAGAAATGITLTEILEGIAGATLAF
jgi:RHS repeat-associated protein